MAVNKNGSRKATIDNRRRAVAGMRLRHLTQREIVTQLPKMDILNPDTGEPYSLGIVNSDLKALHKQWQEDAAQDTSVLVAMTRAELEEVRRKAWANNELAIVLRSLRQECDLLGLDAPTKVAPTDPTGTKEYDSSTDTERIGKLLGILDAARTRRDSDDSGRDDTGSVVA